MNLRITNLRKIVAVGGSRAGFRLQVCLNPKSGLWPLLFTSPSHQYADDCCVHCLESWTWGCAGHTYSFWDSSLRAGNAEAWRCWVTGPWSHGEVGPSPSDSRTHTPVAALHGSDRSGHGHAARKHWSLSAFHSMFRRRKCSWMNENHHSYQFNTKHSKIVIGHLACFWQR